MKIKKLSYIKSLGVFKDFDWDQNVVHKKSQVGRFEMLNIIYGRNYSGKTTLSRIFRRIENNARDSLYAGSSYKIKWYDDSESDQDNCCEKGVNIRVYNEDFRRENLNFPNCLSDDKKIVPFAILGENNVNISRRINEIKDELGNDEVGSETGKYEILKQIVIEHKRAEGDYKKTLDSFENNRHNFCTKGKESIKKLHEIYGDINYDIRKLEHDISTIQRENISAMDESVKSKYLLIAKSSDKLQLNKIKNYDEEFNKILEQGIELARYKLCDDQKIVELLNDIALQEWVYRGKQLHSESDKTCKFCGNPISSERWEKIINHFDDESEKTLTEIEFLIKQLETLKTTLNNIFNGVVDGFFDSLKEEVRQLVVNYMASKHTYIDKIDYVISKLHQKKHMLSSVVEIDTAVLNVDNYISRYNQLVEMHNDMSANLAACKIDAKNKLRLDAVIRYLESSNYFQLKDEIKSLQEICSGYSRDEQLVRNEIKELQKELSDCESALSDERAGADAVNCYLRRLDNCNLSLRVIDEKYPDGKYFMVCRDGNAAHNLSEGEKNLISFCYFVAKLKDVNSDSISKIIWIDDPISSLDSNHVFFVYSMIQKEIFESAYIEQLFISTHNLLFLKYLKRLHRCENGQAVQRAWFIVERNFENSIIKPMPDFMKDYMSEFEFLFKQIHVCAVSHNLNNDNYDCFYNFGNCARKFLELYASFIRPSMLKDGKLEEAIFRDLFSDDLEAISIYRSLNEFSHLMGGIERSQLIHEYPEINSLAHAIIKFVYTRDPQQYKSLCDSVHVDEIFP